MRSRSHAPVARRFDQVIQLPPQKAAVDLTAIVTMLFQGTDYLGDSREASGFGHLKGMLQRSRSLRHGNLSVIGELQVVIGSSCYCAPRGSRPQPAKTAGLAYYARRVDPLSLSIILIAQSRSVAASKSDFLSASRMITLAAFSCSANERNLSSATTASRASKRIPTAVGSKLRLSSSRRFIGMS